MSMVDSSAMVAILTGEEDGPVLASRLERIRSPFTSALHVVETVLALRRKFEISFPRAHQAVAAFLVHAEIRTVEIGADMHIGAIKAYELYGKGTGHPAQLNLADCFAYALAKHHGVPLLYKGSDFGHTDLR